MIIITTGDLLKSNADALVNAVNTVGVMGKGIALQFKEAFPYNYKIYKAACNDGTFAVGKIVGVKDSNPLLGNKLIVNFPSKAHWRNPSKYEYIESGLVALADYIKMHQVKSIAIPPLGCGLGGLDWAVVKPMMERYLSSSNADIFLYEPLS